MRAFRQPKDEEKTFARMLFGCCFDLSFVMAIMPFELLTLFVRSSVWLLFAIKSNKNAWQKFIQTMKRQHRARLGSWQMQTNNHDLGTIAKRQASGYLEDNSEAQFSGNTNIGNREWKYESSTSLLWKQETNNARGKESTTAKIQLDTYKFYTLKLVRSGKVSLHNAREWR